MYLKEFQHKIFARSLDDLPETKTLVSTMNAYSFCVLQKDKLFQQAINDSHLVLSDGVSVVWAMDFLYGQRLKKIAGADLFKYEMELLQQKKGKCFFFGSSDSTLSKICYNAKQEYPDVKVQCYQPPYRDFTPEENESMVAFINSYKPDVLFVGMTAPKQEKWAAEHFEKLNAKHICCIGAVFDFYAGNVNRAPEWIINMGLEWLYRLVKEPKRMWKRYLIGNSHFLLLIFKEKLVNKFCSKKIKELKPQFEEN